MAKHSDDRSARHELFPDRQSTESIELVEHELAELCE
jgi:hypothetical protein